jgi:hypothetical protein
MAAADREDLIQHRDALRRRARAARAAADGCSHPIPRHRYLRAARMYDEAAALAVRADHLEIQAVEYSRDPGGGEDAEPV